MRGFIISLFLTLGMLSLSTRIVLSAPTTESCEEALVAQDEVVKLLDQQVAELKAAVASRKEQVAALEKEVATLQEQADVYRKMWVAEAAVAEADRKRAVWREMWTALKWGVAGAASGVLMHEAVD